MSNVQIPNLPVASSLGGNEEIEIVQGGVSRRTTTQAIADLNPPQGTVTQVDTAGGLSGGPITTTGTIQIAAAGVDNTKLADMPAQTVKGNDGAITGPPSDISMATLSTMLSLAPSATIDTTDADNITSGQLSDQRYYQTLSDALTRMVAPITPDTGTLFYYDGTDWTALTNGTSGQVLRSRGSGLGPEWFTTTGTGTVTQINTGTGLTGGPVTTSGTISIANTGVTAGSYGAANQTYQLSVNAQGQLTSVTAISIDIDASQITTGLLPAIRGGTGLANFTIGDILYASASNTFARLSAGNAEESIVSAGIGLPPVYKKVSLSAGVTGTLPVGNGGTGATTLTGYVKGNGTSAFTASATIPNTDITGLGTMSVQNANAVAITGGTATLTSAALTSGTIVNAPVNPTDIVNKTYVDSVAEGLKIKASVEWATTGNITLSGLGTQTNGEWTGTLVAGTRILVKNQSAPAQNGIYLANSSTWARALDANTWDELVSAFVFVHLGATLADTGWVCTVDPGGTLGTTPVTWTQFSGAGTYTAGTGLTLSGTVFSITNTGVAAANYGTASSVPTIAVNAQGQITSASNTAIAIDTAAITSGILGVPRGGTGVATVTGYLKGNGTSAFSGVATIPNTDITGLGSMSVQNAASVSITGGSIDGTTIGASAASSGVFTSLTATSLTGFVYANGASPMTASTTIPNTAITGLGTMSVQNANSVAITGGSISGTSIDNSVIGAVTPAAGTFSSMTATTATISGGSINGTSIGATTRSSGAFTTLDANGNVTLGDASADTVTINGTVQPGVVIEGSSSGNALRITQTGSGNALLVEDDSNPDATPFVVDGSGRVVVGNSTASTGAISAIPNIQLQGTTSSSSQMGLFRFSADASQSALQFLKSRGSLGGQGVVSSGDFVGTLRFAASDGSSFLQAATIDAVIDGTPGTNDMPGRLVFSTTADGASSPTERMRIDSAGQVGIGTTSVAGRTFSIAKNITGSTGSYGALIGGTVQSDVTFAAYYVSTVATTAAASFTLTNVIHFRANQGTFGLGSTVTNQFGFQVNSTLIGATNNYGFYGDIPDGSGRWNFYANGTAPNYFNGITTFTKDVLMTGTGGLEIPAGTTAERPSTPSAGYVRYNTTTAKFEGYGSTWGNLGGGAAISDTPPANPGAGDLWWSSADGNLYVYYTDVDGSQWVSTTSGGQGAYLPLTGGTLTGSLEFAGTGRRITGDFSNATVANRLLFQSSTTNGATSVQTVPNGTGTDSGWYAANADGANSAFTAIRATGADSRIQSGVFGTGTYLPMTFYTGGSERVRIDTSGNVGIGTSSPAKKFELKGDTGFRHTSNGGGNEYYDFGRDPVDGLFGFNGAQTSFVGYKWLINGTERARIDASGNFLVGTTSGGAKFRAMDNTVDFQIKNGYTIGGSNYGAYFYTGGNNGIALQAHTTGGIGILQFFNPNGAVGNIVTSGSSTSYNTSSDYRLKENVTPMQNALATISALNPVTYTWKADGSDGQGFIAHELQAVVPDAVTGEKDAVDADGNPIHQGVDPSKLVATLVAAMQELKSELDAVKAELATLKGA